MLPLPDCRTKVVHVHACCRRWPAAASLLTRATAVQQWEALAIPMVDCGAWQQQCCTWLVGFRIRFACVCVCGASGVPRAPVTTASGLLVWQTCQRHGVCVFSISSACSSSDASRLACGVSNAAQTYWIGYASLLPAAGYLLHPPILELRGLFGSGGWGEGAYNVSRTVQYLPESFGSASGPRYV